VWPTHTEYVFSEVPIFAPDDPEGQGYEDGVFHGCEHAYRKVGEERPWEPRKGLLVWSRCGLGASDLPHSRYRSKRSVWMEEKPAQTRYYS
jgi:hypothetical protein